ncbi:SPOR domain-containing protein [Limnohabitans sp. MMS-10A-178]|uniref:SPOR domain-containing protein n=1 Tax=Limnohabitans sp. MMS-10A-178 TaxID=1835767 RepID=UPI000D38A201|nr:SPOR domain-containing protein [Limnohabitans sp. MMS-10A-178]PUE16571.1 sporulation protein [Limnohabitans sp. MMS-10A-178]
MSHSNIQRQRGGTLLGFVLGLVIGLTVALGVAMYVTKVPMPFSNKNQTRSADQDAVEAQKNKDWNPNGALQSKPAAPAVPPDAAAAPNTGAAGAAGGAATAGTPGTTGPTGSTGATPPAANMPAPAVTADPPIAAPAPAATPQPATKAAASSDPFTYFVQAGAFKSAADADAQKAKLSMMGIEAKVSEREQAGRAIFRVRSGPFDDKEQAEKIKSRLDASGMDAALVRVQR